MMTSMLRPSPKERLALHGPLPKHVHGGVIVTSETVILIERTQLYHRVKRQHTAYGVLEIQEDYN